MVCFSPSSSYVVLYSVLVRYLFIFLYISIEIVTVIPMNLVKKCSAR